MVKKSRTSVWLRVYKVPARIRAGTDSSVWNGIEAVKKRQKFGYAQFSGFVAFKLFIVELVRYKAAKKSVRRRVFSAVTFPTHALCRGITRRRSECYSGTGWRFMAPECPTRGY